MPLDITQEEFLELVSEDYPTMMGRYSDEMLYNTAQKRLLDVERMVDYMSAAADIYKSKKV